MDRLDNPSKLRAYKEAESLKKIMRPLFEKHMDDIMSGNFSETMMKDWDADDKDLLGWREATGQTAFEKAVAQSAAISEQEYFDKGILMIAMVKAGVELAFEVMTESGIKAESAYYESLHELPLIANLISRKKLYEMNRIISDTAEYGCYLFSNACTPLLADYMKGVKSDIIGKGLTVKDLSVDNRELISVNDKIRIHPIEKIGKTLRGYMTAMKSII